MTGLPHRFSSTAFSFTISAKCKIGDCVQSEAKAYGGTIGHVVLAPGEANSGHLIATDGRVLAVVPVEGENLPESNVFLPADAVKSGNRSITVTVNSEVRATAGKYVKSYPLPEQVGLYPSVKDIFPESLSDYCEVRLNAKDLANLASAISPDGIVRLYFHADEDHRVTKPMVARGETKEGEQQTGFGLISVTSPGVKGPLPDYRREILDSVNRLPRTIDIKPLEAKGD
jgi:hypothetical protein